MNLKLFIIIILVLVLFVNTLLFCKKIEKFADKTDDERQDDAISDNIDKLSKLEKEYNETDNQLEPIRTQITDLDSTITNIDDKIKANLSLELTERNSNRVRIENEKLNKRRKNLITQRNDLIAQKNELDKTNRDLNDRINKGNAQYKTLSYQTRALQAEYRGLRDSGYVAFYNNRKIPIYTLRNNSKSRETNGNPNVLRDARYCSVSPGHRVILFDNSDWSCKSGRRYIVISGGRSGINKVDLNKYISHSYNQTYNKRVFKNMRVRVRVGWRRRWRWRWRKRWVNEKRTRRKNVKWNEITRSVRLERIINNDYRKGKVDIRLDNTTCRTPS